MRKRTVRLDLRALSILYDLWNMQRLYVLFSDPHAGGLRDNHTVWPELVLELLLEWLLRHRV